LKQLVKQEKLDFSGFVLLVVKDLDWEKEVKEFIEKLEDPEQQESCNQLNRRTEFRVLRITYGMVTTPIESPNASGQ